MIEGNFERKISQRLCVLEDDKRKKEAFLSCVAPRSRESLNFIESLHDGFQLRRSKVSDNKWREIEMFDGFQGSRGLSELVKFEISIFYRWFCNCEPEEIFDVFLGKLSQQMQAINIMMETKLRSHFISLVHFVSEELIIFVIIDKVKIFNPEDFIKTFEFYFSFFILQKNLSIFQVLQPKTKNIQRVLNFSPLQKTYFQLYYHKKNPIPQVRIPKRKSDNQCLRICALFGFFAPLVGKSADFLGP